MNKYFDDNNELTEEGKKWMEKLNKFNQKCNNISKATCWETDQEVADAIKNINKVDNTDELEL